MERRRPATHRGNNSSNFIEFNSVACSDGRDATNFALRRNFLHLNLKRVASTSLERYEREEIVLSVSTSSTEDIPLSTPPPSSLGHIHNSWSGQSLRCIRFNNKCLKAGWAIEEYCEACHG